MERYIPLVLLTTCLACNDTAQKSEPTASTVPDSASAPEPLFRLVPVEQSGIDFANKIYETPTHHLGNFHYIYNGNGVAVGDVNGDSLPDVYITGNYESDHLYLNKGGLRFEDITERAGVSNADGWKTGVCMVDIDVDGDLDVYVCRSWSHDSDEKRRNLLYINNGDLTFTESARAWGIDDPGYSVMAAFSDLDGDDDLDMYLMNHPIDFDQTLDQRMEAMKDPAHVVMDRLYRNDGGHFTDVSIPGGIREYGHGLGLVIWDANEDGRDDIYVANDFQSTDYLWINQGGMKFKNEIASYFPHISYFSMGCDVADFDNDLDDDLYVDEMLPWERRREIMNLSDIDEFRYGKFVEYGFHHQYMRNVLQVNHGKAPDPDGSGASRPRFSDVAWISGTARTDWSWATLFVDLDNDGWKDIIVANGYLRDAKDRDFIKRTHEMLKANQGRSTLADIDRICRSVKIPNKVFRNLGGGGIRFEDVSKAWGIREKAFSYGAAHADLDRDGDLDLVITNTTFTLAPDPAYVYENRLVQQKSAHWLRVHLRGCPKNTFGEGARVKIGSGDLQQVQTMRFTRGYQSTVEPVLHFGLGDAGGPASLSVTWPDGKVQNMENVAADREVVVRYENAVDAPPAARPVPPTLTRVDPAGWDRRHKDELFDDYQFQAQLPEKLSYGGPCMAVADVNADGIDDVYFGGGAGRSGAVLIGRSDGGVRSASGSAFAADKDLDDRAAVFLDLEGDGDRDLIVGSGGTASSDPSKLQLRLYVNDGRGGFKRSTDAIADVRVNAGALAAADINGDGAMDLFVGGRSIPFDYPRSPRSYVLQNVNGRLQDVTSNVGPELEYPGMITGAAFADLDGDADADLVLAGDWTGVRFFRNDGGMLRDATEQWCPGSPTGWWRALAVGDVDGDGDADVVAGNYGSNHRYQIDPEHPLLMLANDFDHNGTNDIVLANWIDGAYRPDRPFFYLQKQFPFLGVKYEWYEDYAAADIVHVFGKDAEEAMRLTAGTFASTLFINENGRFIPRPLPDMAQLGSINAIALHDVDGDARPEIVMAGNTFHGPVEIEGSDAGIGAVLERQQDGSWRVLPIAESGFYEPGMVRSIAVANKLLVVGNNDGPVHLYRSAAAVP